MRYSISKSVQLKQYLRELAKATRVEGTTGERLADDVLIKLLKDARVEHELKYKACQALRHRV